MPRLLVTSQGPPGLALDLGVGAYRIGRNTGNDLQIEHPSISSSHCEVMVISGALLVRDLGSTNGTFIDRQQIKEGCLEFGQTLQVGIIELMLEEPLRVIAPCASADAQTEVAPFHGCIGHPEREASFLCHACDQYLCASCVRHLRRMEGASLRICPACAAECEQIARLPELRRPVDLSAEPQEPPVRPGLFPHLAHWLRTGLLMGLISQRRQLLQVQAMATRQAEEFANRLATVAAEMRQRIAEYETRIAALEKELAAAELEKRELIRNQIIFMKRALAEERAQEQFADGQTRSLQLSNY
jgi:hypothetical protein